MDDYIRQALRDRVSSLNQYDKDLLTPDKFVAPETNVNYGGVAINSAIQNKANRMFNNPEQLRQLKFVNALNERQSNIDKTNNLLLRQLSLDKNALGLAEAQSQQRQANRNAVIGTLFGGVGAIGGAAIGGPAGAGAGYNIGSGLGNAAVSSRNF